jgi:hypothetical protein
MVVTRRLLLRTERPPERRARAEQAEEVRGHERVRHRVLAAVGQQREEHLLGAGDHLERMRARRPGVHQKARRIARRVRCRHHRRESGDEARMADRLQGDDAVTVVVGKRGNEQPVDDAEDRRVRADAEGERDDGDRGERACLAEMPQREADVVHPLDAEVGDALPVSAPLGALHGVAAIHGQIAEATVGFGFGLGRAQPAGAEIFGPELDVEAHLFIGLLNQAPACRRKAKEPPNVARKSGFVAHGVNVPPADP